MRDDCFKQAVLKDCFYFFCSVIRHFVLVARMHLRISKAAAFDWLLKLCASSTKSTFCNYLLELYFTLYFYLSSNADSFEFSNKALLLFRSTRVVFGHLRYVLERLWFQTRSASTSVSSEIRPLITNYLLGDRNFYLYFNRDLRHDFYSSTNDGYFDRLWLERADPSFKHFVTCVAPFGVSGCMFYPIMFVFIVWIDSMSCWV